MSASSSLLSMGAGLLLLGCALSGCNRPSEPPPSTVQDTNRLVFGLTPSLHGDSMFESAQPLAQYLTREVGIPVEIYVASSYGDLISEMKDKRIDIASLPALTYVLVRDQRAATPLLQTQRKGRHSYHSVFLARAGSGIRGIRDAKGKRMAFVDPASASGYLFPRAHLKQSGIDPDAFFSKTSFCGSHDKVVEALYRGQSDVAAVYDDARGSLEKALPDVRRRVVKIGQTGEIPNDTISVRPGLPVPLMQKIKTALRAFGATPQGKKALAELFGADALVETNDGTYDTVRQTAAILEVPLEHYGLRPAVATASAGLRKTP